MDRRVVGGLFAVVAVAVLGWWLLRGAHPTPSPSSPDAATAAHVAVPPADARDAGVVAPPRPPERTVRDRALRDALRRRIYAAWTAGAPPAPDAPARRAPDPLHAPMPQRDGGVDPGYLRERIREDFVPMAQVCYDQLLTRRPGTAGRVVMRFVIVGDPQVGGVVDEASADVGDAGLGDAEFETCLRESMMAMAFRPPPNSGRLRVTYPLRLAPDAPDGG